MTSLQITKVSGCYWQLKEMLIQEGNRCIGHLLYGKYYFRCFIYTTVPDCYRNSLNLELLDLQMGEQIEFYFPQGHIVSGRTGI